MLKQRPPDEVRRQMQQIRRQFRDDVDDVVQSAREFANWKSYVRAHPWICIGAAAAVGYLIVPARFTIQSPDAEALRELAEQNRLVIEANPQPAAKSSWLGAAAALVSRLLVRQVVSLAGQKLSEMFADDHRYQASQSPQQNLPR